MSSPASTRPTGKHRRAERGERGNRSAKIDPFGPDGPFGVAAIAEAGTKQQARTPGQSPHRSGCGVERMPLSYHRTRADDSHRLRAKSPAWPHVDHFEMPESPARESERRQNSAQAIGHTAASGAATQTARRSPESHDSDANARWLRQSSSAAVTAQRSSRRAGCRLPNNYSFRCWIRPARRERYRCQRPPAGELTIPEQYR